LSGRAIDAYYARAGSARLDGDAEILNSRLALSCLRRINRQRSRSALDPLGSPVFRDNSFGAPLRKIAVRFFSTMSFRATRRFPARRARRTCRFFPPPHSRSLDSAFSTFLFQRLLSLSLSLSPPQAGPSIISGTILRLFPLRERRANVHSRILNCGTSLEVRGGVPPSLACSLALALFRSASLQRSFIVAPFSSFERDRSCHSIYSDRSKRKASQIALWRPTVCRVLFLLPV